MALEITLLELEAFGFSRDPENYALALHGEPGAGGCPLMVYPPVDGAHRCMRWWLSRRGRIPV